MANTVLQGEVEGNGSRGRPVRQWLDDVKEWTGLSLNEMWTDMSFCRGSVNCHGSDGQMYNFCESSRSGEIFLDQYRGVGVFIPRDKLIRIGLFRSVNRPFVASES